MKFSKEDRDSIQKLHLLSGLPYEECKEFFKYFVVMLAIDYMEGRTTNFPFIGNLRIEYLGDSIKKAGKEAILSTEMEPEAFLRRLIGDIEDGAETEVHRILKKDIKRYFERFDGDE